MTGITVAFLCTCLAIFAYRYLTSKKGTTVAMQHQVPMPEGGITAIEYFWRPG